MGCEIKWSSTGDWVDLLLYNCIFKRKILKEMRGNEFFISHWKTFQVHFVNNLSGSTICTFSHLYFSSSEAALHNSFFRRTYLSLCSQPPAKHLLLRPDALLNLPRIWKRKKKTCRRKCVSGRGATKAAGVEGFLRYHCPLQQQLCQQILCEKDEPCSFLRRSLLARHTC